MRTIQVDEFSFDDFMMKALLNERREQGRKDRLKRNNGCPEATNEMHSDPNTSGNCVFCGKYLGRRARPTKHVPYKPELDLAYEYHYDPDFGKDNLDKY